MKNLFRGTTALVALTFAHSQNAMAQTDWSGTFIGLNIGTKTPEFTNEWNSGSSSQLGPANDLNDPGLSFGAVLGHLWQTGRRILGVEAELGAGTLVNSAYYLSSTGDITNSERVELKISNLASIRARAGLALNDENMIYATAGMGFVSAEFSASTSDTHPYTGTMDISALAPVIGLGYERKLSDRMTLNVNVSRFDVGESHVLGAFGDGGTTDSAINFGEVTRATLGFSFKL